MTKMNSKISIIFTLTFIVYTQAGIIAPVRTVEVLQGPSSKTTIVGPDGGAISSVAPGGQVVTDGQAVVPVGHAVLAVGPEAVVAGPAGSIATSYTLAGPAVVAAAPVAVAPVVAAGHEGAYVPDNTEHLYDDGSYKGE